MATQAGMGLEVSKRGAEPQSLQMLIENSAKELGRALPEGMKPDRIVQIALTCIRLNPELAKCTPESFLGALFTAAQIGIEPINGRAYLMPFKNTRKVGNEYLTLMEVQFVLGYPGLAELFFRHDKAIELSWGTVHENDDFSYALGTESFLAHRPADKNRGPVKGYYAVAKLVGGGQPFLYMSRQDCLEHGQKHSKTFDARTGKFNSKSPWYTNEDSMCLKTVLRQLMKLLPMSSTVQKALAADETSREYRSGIKDMLDLPSTTTWDVEAGVVPIDMTEGAVEAEPSSYPPPTPEEPPNMEMARVQDVLSRELSAFCEKHGADPEDVLKEVSKFTAKNSGKEMFLTLASLPTCSDKWAGTALGNLRKEREEMEKPA